MIKLDRKKSKKVCALLLTGVLATSLVGCTSQAKEQEKGERISHGVHSGDFYVTDNETNITIELSDEVIEKIKSGEEDVTISFNGNDINMDESEITKIRELVNKTENSNNKFNILCYVVFPTLFGLLLMISIRRCLKTVQVAEARMINKLSDEAFKKLCDEKQNDERYIKKLQKIRKNK